MKDGTGPGQQTGIAGPGGGRRRARSQPNPSPPYAPHADNATEFSAAPRRRRRPGKPRHHRGIDRSHRPHHRRATRLFAQGRCDCRPDGSDGGAGRRNPARWPACPAPGRHAAKPAPQPQLPRPGEPGPGLNRCWSILQERPRGPRRHGKRTDSHRPARPGRPVQLQVHDNGPGLSDEARARLFTPFHTTKPDGLGLGLVISRDIVAEFGGELRAARQAMPACRLPMRPAAAPCSS